MMPSGVSKGENGQNLFNSDLFSESFNFSSLDPTSHTTETDVFGFGSFDRVFMTQEELDKSKEKLPEEVLSSEDMVRNMITRLNAWQCTTDTQSAELCDAFLCFQFIEIGFGHLDISNVRGIAWTGRFLHEPEIKLFWPYGVLTDLRSKLDPDSDHKLIMMTIAETLFVQIKLGNTESDSILDRILGLQRDAMNDLKTSNLPKSDSGISLDRLEDHEQTYRLAKENILRERDLKIQKIMQESEEKLKKLELEYLAQQSSNTQDPPQTCQLCYDHDDACKFYPCGHQLCGQCLAQLGYTPSSDTITFCCPWDRSAIQSIIILGSQT